MDQVAYAVLLVRGQKKDIEIEVAQILKRTTAHLPASYGLTFSEASKTAANELPLIGEQTTGAFSPADRVRLFPRQSSASSIAVLHTILAEREQSPVRNRPVSTRYP